MGQTKIMSRTQKRVPIISIIKEYECDSVPYQFQNVKMLALTLSSMHIYNIHLSFLCAGRSWRIIGRFLKYGNEYHCRLYGNCALNTELIRRQLLKMRMSLKITDKRTCLMIIAKRTQLCRETFTITLYSPIKLGSA
ncbi:hypothetical protein C5167_048773 [Papaver somniferum]|uniref:Uncharacterized protein n=1 Tax=Papaver somniferum TaxID=3469 RepID=A0A4Y7KIX1_PAPSO|nr:hypothetical protein C5167_048773 [Papaver somniferum]